MKTRGLDKWRQIKVTFGLPMSLAASTPEDLVYQAIAHAARRQMMDLVKATPGMTVAGVASHFSFSRIATMKHLARLEGAGLIISKKDGRSRKLYFNPMPIQGIYDRWTSDESAFWAGRLADMQQRVQARAQKRNKKNA